MDEGILMKRSLQLVQWIRAGGWEWEDDGGVLLLGGDATRQWWANQARHNPNSARVVGIRACSVVLLTFSGLTTS